MNAILWLVSGAGFSWGLTQLLDERGRRRRALVRDKVVSAAHAIGDAIDTTSRDVGNRTRGVIAELGAWRSADGASDRVLVQRVRARLARWVRHPRAIEVTAREGRVTLRGPVLADEVDALLAGVAAIRGIQSVDNGLEVHAEPGNVPGLQGTPRRRRAGGQFELAQARWSPAARLLVGIGGGVLALGAIRRRGVTGTIAGAAGLAALARAVTNLELRELVRARAGRWAISVQKTLIVAAPIEEVYALWSHYESFPRFMAHVREVRRIGAGRSRWTVAGPAGVPVEWETEETRREPPTLLAWRTIEGSTVAHAGSVRFQPVPEGTRIHVRMQYDPPAGVLGHGVAALLGADPRRSLDEDLVRFKSLLEEGKTSVRGQTVTRDVL